jgi:hypothetical protein
MVISYILHVTYLYLDEDDIMPYCHRSNYNADRGPCMADGKSGVFFLILKLETIWI